VSAEEKQLVVIFENISVKFSEHNISTAGFIP